MNFAKQHPLAWGLMAASLALLGWVAVENPAPSQVPTNLPKVEKTEHKAYTEKLVGKVTFDLVPIPGGTFLMGSPDGEKGRQADEGQQHPVAVKPFWMGKCEVTWDEYDLYRKEEAVESSEVIEKKLKADSDAITGPTRPYADETFGHGRDGNPALCITWHATMNYCRWLSKKTGKKYRLPTEAEWEWAARAGTATAYSFGDDPTKLDDFAWYAKTSDDAAHQVGKKKANAWGLYDMYGNVSEWCLDQYKKDYYSTLARNKLSLNPFLEPGPNRYPHVVRGGSWVDPPEKCRSAARQFSDKDWLRRDPQRPQSIWWMTDADFVGFRVVRTVDENDNLWKVRSKITRESADN